MLRVMFDFALFDIFRHRAETGRVSCLRCGYARTTHRSLTGELEPAACPKCDYVGWRPSRPMGAGSSGPPSGGLGAQIH